MSNKAIFLDRDDTLIKDPGYISSPEQVELLDGVTEALIKLKKLDYKLIVVSNQSAVARGIVTEKNLEKIHGRLKQLLAEKNAYLDRIYYCPYHPDGVIPKYRKESNNRKPNPGMLLAAAKDMDIDLEQSWCIGNSIRDVEAGQRAGCKTILIDAPSRQKQPDSRPVQSGIRPDYRGINLREAVNIIKKHLNSQTGKQTKNRQAADTNVEQTEELTKLTEDSPSEPEQSAAEATQQNQKMKNNFPEITETAQKITESTIPADIDNTQPEQENIQANNPEQNPTNNRIEQLLTNILGQLRNMQRSEMFSEFSIMRLMAGIVQIIVLFCLLITIWFLMSPENRDNAIFIALGFAIVFQLMSLTFYIMHGRK
ncbi:MAG: HAD family hydrolase [Sedimentisphaerales bacterium]|nr:HAD family hydrolase [Sedimentisphaerales bacterium]